MLIQISLLAPVWCSLSLCAKHDSLKRPLASAERWRRLYVCVCTRWINVINRELDLSAIGTTFYSTQDLEPEEEEREENAFIQNNCLWVINIWKEAYSLANPCTCFQLFIHILGGGRGWRRWVSIAEGGWRVIKNHEKKSFFFFFL